MKVVTYFPGLIGYLSGREQEHVIVPDSDIDSVSYPMGITY